MNKRKILLLILVSMCVVWISCEDYATGIDPFIASVEDELLTSEAQIPFAINGVQGKFSDALDHMVTIAGVLSDELIYDQRVPGATYPDWAQFDVGFMLPDFVHLDGTYNDIGELRFYADDLLRRTGEVTFTDQALRTEALFTGYLYGGIARYLYAAYWGLSQTEPGSPINVSAFIPADEIYLQAIGYLNNALANTADAYMTRVINTLIARINLFEADYTAAATAAANGMVDGDAPFQALYHTDWNNSWYHNAGQGRTVAVADWRFLAYVTADANEANRIPMATIMSAGLDSTIFYMQDKYPLVDSPITFLSWQENELILAECNLRGAGAGVALNRINDVRDSHGIDPLVGVITMADLITERDKELVFTGNRLIDQRRLDAEYATWHLGAGTWQFFTLPDNERNANPNL